MSSSNTESKVSSSDVPSINPAAVAVVGGAGDRSEPRVDVPEGEAQASSVAGKYLIQINITGDSSVATRMKGGT